LANRLDAAEELFVGGFVVHGGRVAW
jgi:hypothetical protein